MSAPGSLVAHSQQVRKRKGLKRAKKASKKPSGESRGAPTLSPKDVQDWLSSIGFPEVGKAARRKRVCGLALPHLGHPGWEELGILSAVGRAIVMGHAAELRANGSHKEQKNKKAEDPASEPSKASNWNRLKQFVRKTDILTPVDHKRLWFEKMTRSGKAPEEIRESMSAQMDSYNLLTLLLLATVIPTATGICAEMRWDPEGWPLSRTRFAYLVFSSLFSFLLYCHFGWSHIFSVMVADCSNPNLKLFLESIGISYLTELGALFALNFFCFFAWVIFTMIALISENAHWAVWLMVSLGVCLMTMLAVHYVSIVMARSGFESHLTCAPYYLRLQVHSGLFSNEPVQLDSGLPRKTLLERLSEKAMQEIEPQSTQHLEHSERPGKDSDASSDHVSEEEDSDEDDENETSDFHVNLQFDV
eukprot:s2958_g2.t1